jgi:hypothetical protein
LAPPPAIITSCALSGEEANTASEMVRLATRPPKTELGYRPLACGKDQDRRRWLSPQLSEVEPLRAQEQGHLVRDLDVIEIREHEV